MSSNRMVARRCGPALAALAVLTLLGASCSRAPKPEYDPGQATAAVQKTLGPTPAQLDCLRGRFEAQPDIATVFNFGDPPSDEQRRAYVAAIRGCIPIDAFAALIATTFDTSTGEPGGAGGAGTADPGATETSRCVQAAVVARPTADQDRLYLYFSNPAAVDAKDMTPITQAISDACGLGPPPPNGTGTTTPGAAATPSTTLEPR